MSSANTWRPTRDSGLQDWGCSAPRPPLASCHRGVETSVVPSPPPSPGHGHCGRCCFRCFSKQTCLSQFLITKSKKHARFLSEYRTCFGSPWSHYLFGDSGSQLRCVGSLLGMQASLVKCTRFSLTVTKSLLKHPGNRGGSSISWPQPPGAQAGPEPQSLPGPASPRHPEAPAWGYSGSGSRAFSSVEAQGACSWRPLAPTCYLPLTLAQSLPKVLTLGTSGGLPWGGRLWPVQEELRREDVLGQDKHRECVTRPPGEAQSAFAQWAHKSAVRRSRLTAGTSASQCVSGYTRVCMATHQPTGDHFQALPQSSQRW